MIDLLRDPVWQFIGALTSIGAVVLAIYVQIRQSVELVRRSREQVAQAESRVEAQPEKAKPAWDLARTTLEAYFNRNLLQITSIFWLSVVVLIIGFVIIIWGISQSIQAPNTLASAAIAAISGIITEFVGATFLFIYRSTIEQAINYSKTLERINSVGMAMQILDTMPDETRPEDLKSSTKAKLVELLVQQAYNNHAQEKIEEDNKNPKK